MNTSPFSLKQPGSVVVAVTVTDEENQPGQSWTFRLRKTQALGFHKAESMKRVLVQRYLTGSPDGTMQPIAFPAVGGQPVELSEDLFEQVANAWAMQEHAQVVPAVDDLDSIHGSVQDGLSCEEIVAMAAVAPNAWVQLLREMGKVQRQGNASAGSGATSAG